MKTLITLMAFILSFSCGSCSSSGSNGQPQIPNPPGGNENNGDNETDENVMIKVSMGSLSYTAVLEENPAAEAFKGMLPLTLNMEDVNSNEKFTRLDRSLPASATNPGTIHTGDIMLWGSNGLVLFYKTFSTSYSYTKLGYIEDPSGLQEAVGTGSVTVKFEISEEE